MIELYDCTRLSAKISRRQCGINRNGLTGRGVFVPAIVTCKGCAGLGESAQPSGRIEQLPQVPKERVMAKDIFGCSHAGCKRHVKKQGDTCWQHKGLEDQVAAGVVQGSAPEAPAAATVGIQYESEAEKAAQAGAALPESEKPTLDEVVEELTERALVDDTDLKECPEWLSAQEPGQFAVLRDPSGAETWLRRKDVASKSLMQLLQTSKPIPPASITLDFTGQEELLQRLGAVSDDLNRDILSLLAALLDGKLLAADTSVLIEAAA